MHQIPPELRPGAEGRGRAKSEESGPGKKGNQAGAPEWGKETGEDEVVERSGRGQVGSGATWES